MKKNFELVTKSLEKTAENLTKAVTETSFKNNKAMESLNEKVLELMNDRGIIAPYFASSLVNLLKLESKSHIILIKHLNST